MGGVYQQNTAGGNLLFCNFKPARYMPASSPLKKVVLTAKQCTIQFPVKSFIRLIGWWKITGWYKSLKTGVDEVKESTFYFFDFCYC